MEENALIPTSTQEVDFYGDLIAVATVNDTPYVPLWYTLVDKNM